MQSVVADSFLPVCGPIRVKVRGSIRTNPVKYLSWEIGRCSVVRFRRKTSIETIKRIAFYSTKVSKKEKILRVKLGKNKDRERIESKGKQKVFQYNFAHQIDTYMKGLNGQYNFVNTAKSYLIGKKNPDFFFVGFVNIAILAC